MKALVIDLGFTVEGQAAEELPEELMGVIRVMNLDPAKAKLTSVNSSGVFETKGLPMQK